MPRKRARRWTDADARAVLVEHAASGLSVGAFARREGIDDWRLYRWRQRLAEEKTKQATTAKARRKRKTPSAAGASTTPTVIELRPSAQRAAVIEIVLASGVTLRVADTIEPSALARLIAALR